jgi:MATE family multidrug resistance protein
LAYTILYIVGGQWIIGLLTDESQVLETSKEYVWWVWLVPAASTLAFIWDGVFIGITATRGMLVSSFISALLFFSVYEIARRLLGNHALWLAMIVYLAMRGIIQTIWYKKLIYNKIWIR